MKTVKNVLDAKGRDVVSVAPDETVYDAFKLMVEKKVSSLLVLEQGRIKGILSERDCSHSVILRDESPKGLSVKQVMSTNVLCTCPDQTIYEAMALVTEKRVRHLPVVDGKKIDGVISIGDLVKAVIADQQFMIEQLENYVSG